MSCIITYKGQKYSEEQFKEYFINNKNEFATSIIKNKDVIDSFKRKMEAIDGVFKDSPELASIGSKAQYLQYLSTIFKTSKVKDIVYRGKTENQTNKKSKELGIFFTDDKNAANIYAIKYKGDEFDDSIIQGVVNKFGLNPTIEQIKSEIAFFEKMGATKEQIEKDAKEFQKYILNNKGIAEQAIINIKNPKNLTVKDWFDNYDNSSSLKENSDGLLLKGGKQSDNRIYDAGENQIVVFEPEQIHTLGSKQDIEGFKKFNNNLSDFISSEQNFKLALKKAIETTIESFILDKDISTNGVYSRIDSIILELDDILKDTEYISEWNSLKEESTPKSFFNTKNILDNNKLLKNLNINILSLPKLKDIFSSSDLLVEKSLTDSLISIKKELIKVTETGYYEVSKVDDEIVNRVTNVVKGSTQLKTVKEFNTSESNVFQKRGNIIDYVFKSFFTSNYSSYDELLENLKKDPYIILNKTIINHVIKINEVVSFEKNIFDSEENFNDILRNIIISSIKYAQSLEDNWFVLSGDSFSKQGLQIGKKELNLIGTFDFLLVNKKNPKQLKVVDLKSTSKDLDSLDESVLEDYSKQIGLYEFLIDNILEKDFTFLNSEIYFIKLNDKLGVVDERNVTTIKYSNEELNNLINDSLNNINDIISKSKIFKLKNNNTNKFSIKLKSTYKQKLTNYFLDKETNPNSKLSDFLNSEDRFDELDQIVNDNEELNTPLTLKEELYILNKRFPEFKDFDKIVDIIKSGVGGRFFINAIYLSRNSNKGVADHESWHRFSQLYLTKEEKQKLYNFIRDQKINFKNREGIFFNSSSAPLMEIEEFLAEEFKNFAKNPNEYNFPNDSKKVVKSIFQEIWDFLKMLLNITDSKMNLEKLLDIFSDLNNGTFDRSNFSNENVIFNSLNSHFIDLNTKKSKLEFDQTLFISTLISENFAEKLTKENKYISEYLIKNGLNTTFKKAIFQEIENLYDSFKSIDINEYLPIKEKKHFEILNHLDLILNDFENYYYNAFLKETNFKTVQTLYRNLKKELSEEDSELLEKGEFIMFKEEKDIPISELSSDALSDFFLGVPHYKESLTINLDQLEENYNDINKVKDFSKDFYNPSSVMENTALLLAGLINEEDWNNKLKYSNSQFLQLPIILFKLNNLKLRIQQEKNNTNQTLHNNLVSLYMEFRDKLSYHKFEILTSVVNTSNTEHSFFTIKFLQNFPTNVKFRFNKLLNSFKNLKKDKSIDIFTELPYLLVQELNNLNSKPIENTYINNLEKEIKLLDTLIYSDKDIYNPLTGDRFFNFDYREIGEISSNPSEENVQKSRFFLSKLGIIIPPGVPPKVYNKQIHPNVARLFDLFITTEKYSSFNDVIKYSHTDNLRSVQIKELLTRFEKLDEYTKRLENETDKFIKFNLDKTINGLRNSIVKLVQQSYSKHPLLDIINISTSDKSYLLSKNHKFAVATPLLINIASVLEQYSSSFKQPSVEVSNTTQNRTSKPSVLTIITDFINSKKLDSLEVNHLNPKVNPHIKYSLTHKTLLDNDVTLEIEKLGSIAVKTDKNSIYEDVLIKDCTVNEKLLNSYLSFFPSFTSNDEPSVITLHNMEASESVFKFRYSNNKSLSLRDPLYIKEGINNNVFNQMLDYFKYSSVKYLDALKNNLNDENSLKIGIFDSMLLDSEISDKKGKKILDAWKKELKKLNLKKPYDVQLDKLLTSEISNSLRPIFDNYFKRSSNEFRKYLNSLEGSLKLQRFNILELFNVTPENEKNLIFEYVIADFFVAFEESILFFGDLTFYKDPSKRRKIIVNTGITAHLDEFSKEIYNDIYQNSIPSLVKDTIANFKKVKPTPLKDINILRFSIVESIKIKPDISSNVAAIKDRDHPDFIKVENFEEPKNPTDGDAYIFLDLLKRVYFKDGKWDNDTMEKEYLRQTDMVTVWLQKKFNPLYTNLGEDKFLEVISWDNKDLYNKYLNTIKNHSAIFTKQKYGTTGVLLELEQHFAKPLFFKPAFNIFLPTQFLSLDSGMNKFDNLFKEAMLNEVDYIVDSGAVKTLSPFLEMIKDFKKEDFKEEGSLKYAEHSAIWFKEQINQIKDSDKSLLGTQRIANISGLLNSLPDIPENEKARKFLKIKLDEFKENVKLILEVNSYILRDYLGVDYINNKWKTIDENKLRQTLSKKLLNSNKTVNSDYFNILKKDEKGYVYDLTFILSNNQVLDIISGMIDDHYRNFRTPGVFYNNSSEDFFNLSLHKRTNRMLKGNTFNKEENKIDHAEVVISFSEKYFSPLFNLTYYENDILTTINEYHKGYSLKEKINKLNELLRTENFIKNHLSSIELSFSRIPFTNINFNGHGRIVEFLLPEQGNIFIVSLANGSRVGLDMDFDKMPIQLKTLDPSTGKPFNVSKEKSYSTLKNELLDIREKIKNLEKDKLDDINLNNILSTSEKYSKIIENIYEIFDKKNINDENEDLNIENGTVAFLNNPNSYLYQIYNDPQNEIRKLKNIGNVKLKENSDESLLLLIDKLFSLIKEVKTNVNTEYKKAIQLESELLYDKNHYLDSRFNDMLSAEIAMFSNPSTNNFVVMSDSLSQLNKKIKTLEGLINDPELTNALEKLENSNIILPHHIKISLIDDLINVKNNKDRHLLGSIIKFISGLVQLVEEDYKISEVFIAGSRTQLKKLRLLKLYPTSNPKAYENFRIKIPNLFGEIPKKFSLRNGKQELITLLLSDKASSYLDLFNNSYTANSTGLTYHNMKVLLAMYALQVPEESIHSFFRSPMVKMLSQISSSNQLEYKNQIRFTLVNMYMNFNKFGDPENANSLTSGNIKYPLSLEDDKGNLNIKLGDQTKNLSLLFQNSFSELKKLLNNENLDITEVINNYSKYINEELNNVKNLKAFEGLDYFNKVKMITFSKEGQKRNLPLISKILFSYYGVINRWGTDLYNLYILDNPISTDLSNMNITNQRLEREAIRKQTNLLYDNNNQSMGSLFEKDKEINSLIYHLALPNLSDDLFKTTLNEMINNIVTLDATETKKVISDILGDIREYLYKNYYEFRINSSNELSTIPKAFEKDFFPIFNNNDDIIPFHQTFSNLLIKYPILKKIGFVNAIREETLLPLSRSSDLMQYYNNNNNLTESNILNLKNQSSIISLVIDTKNNSLEAKEEKQAFQSQFARLINFSSTDWLSIIPPSQTKLYSNKDVQNEISEFFRLFQYYILNISNPWRKIQNTMADLIPEETISKIMKISLDNFIKKQSKTLEKEEVYNDFKEKFYQFNKLNTIVETKTPYYRKGILKPYELNTKASIIYSTNKFTINPEGGIPLIEEC